MEQILADIALMLLIIVAVATILAYLIVLVMALTARPKPALTRWTPTYTTKDGKLTMQPDPNGEYVLVADLEKHNA